MSKLPKLELTQRQRQILERAAVGAGDKEIADALKISPHTVNSHFRILYKKTGMKNRTSLCTRFTISDPRQSFLKF